MLFPSLFRHLKWNSGHGRSRRRPSTRRLLRLEVLEDRTVPSTLTVTSAADDGSAGSLRALLAAAHTGDTIAFATQLNGHTIGLTQGQLVVSQSLAILGPGAAKLAINGEAASRIFDVGGGATVTISGLTLTGGLATDGAGILNAGNLTLSNDVLRANVAQGVAGGGLFGDGGGRGGGVENEAGATLAVSHSAFTGNEALGGASGGNAFGGGIYNEAGTVTIDSSTFTGNQAVAADGGTIGAAATLTGGVSATVLGVGAGGGVWNDCGSLTVTNSTLSNNLDQGGSNGDASGSTAGFAFVGTAVGGGIGSGAFFTPATPTLTIVGSTLTGNQSHAGTNVIVPGFSGNDHSSARGGAIGALAGDVFISNSAIGGNLAEGSAGIDFAQGSAIFPQLTFGGGIDDEPFGNFPASPTLSITGSTVSGNMALGNGPQGYSYGGGLASNNVNAQLINSTVSGNEAIGGAGGGTAAIQALNGGYAKGGGIHSLSGSLTISGSSVKDNLAEGGSGGGPLGSGEGHLGAGGGINYGGTSFVLTNSTLRIWPRSTSRIS